MTMANLWPTSLFLLLTGCPADFVEAQGEANDGATDSTSVTNDAEVDASLVDSDVGTPPVDSAVSIDTASDVVAPSGCAAGCRTCKEVHDLAGKSADGDYEIDIDGAGPRKPFTVYCRGMSTASPTEYLNLTTTSDWNHSTARGCLECAELRAQFSRVRFDPAALQILAADDTFAVYTGPRECHRTNCLGTFAGHPKNSAGEIVLLYSNAVAGPYKTGVTISNATASLNLDGTPFVVTPATIAALGKNPAPPAADYSPTASPSTPANKKWQLSAGPKPFTTVTAWYGPTSASGFRLQLSFE